MHNKLIFLHIPKNGGTTIHGILDRFYPPESVFTIRIIDNIRTNSDEFKQMSPEQRKKILLFKGHMEFGAHRYLYGKYDYFTFLRRPEDRITSYYYYVLRRPQHRLYDYMKSNEFSLHDFVLHAEEGDINNAQIRMISGINDSEELMLEKALENIERHFSFVGFLDKFDESLIYLKNLYQWQTPYYVKQNVTKSRKKSADLDRQTLEAIEERNRGDYILYEKVEKVFREKISALPELENELKKLRFYNAVYNSIPFKFARMLQENMR